LAIEERSSRAGDPQKWECLGPFPGVPTTYYTYATYYNPYTYHAYCTCRYHVGRS
jgi:hypothetical protein